MQPRSSPPLKSVTKVAPGAPSAVMRRGLVVREPKPRADRAARDRDEREPELLVPLMPAPPRRAAAARAPAPGRSVNANAA